MDPVQRKRQPIVYLARASDDLANAKLWAGWLTKHYQMLVIVPWVTLIETWNDSDPADRELGLELDMHAIDRSDWLIGVLPNKLSKGYVRDTDYAVTCNKLLIEIVANTPDELDPLTLAFLEKAFGKRIVGESPAVS